MGSVGLCCFTGHGCGNGMEIESGKGKSSVTFGYGWIVLFISVYAN